MHPFFCVDLVSNVSDLPRLIFSFFQINKNPDILPFTELRGVETQITADYAPPFIAQQEGKNHFQYFLITNFVFKGTNFMRI